MHITKKVVNLQKEISLGSQKEYPLAHRKMSPGSQKVSYALLGKGMLFNQQKGHVVSQLSQNIKIYVIKL